jgi:hypothetical protein
VFGRWRKRDKNMHALDREGDPRGGEQSPGYRFARPEDVVEEDGTAMSGPGGAPEDPLDAEERRERDRAG